MSTLLLTVLLASLFFALGCALFSIGWILRGRTTIRPGGCGIDPTKKQDDSCGETKSCALCEPQKREKKEKEHDEP